MSRRVAYLTVVPALVAVLGGCAGLGIFNFYVPRAPWRDAEERACMDASRTTLASVTYVRQPRINGRGSCGVYAPIKVAAFAGGSVGVNPSPTLGCPMGSTLDGWIREAVQPAAMAWFGVPVVEVEELDAYSCRTVDSIPGENLSEHAFGNAIDIAGYKLADGRVVTVQKDFLRGEASAKGFLHEIFAAACERFKTVLGPGYPAHDDHFHVDLAHQNAEGTMHYCNPKPDVKAPDRTPYSSPAVAASSPPFGLRYPRGLDPKVTGSISTPLTPAVR